MRTFSRGVLETVAIVIGFVAVGLFGAGVAGPAASQRDAAEPPGVERSMPYPSTAMAAEDALPEPKVWLVDGFNALHVALLHGRERADWWTRERREELLERVRAFDDPTAEVWVVFDGPHPAPEGDGAGAGGLRVAFARSADEWLLKRVRESAAGEVVVVTADRPLADKARARGARVMSPHAFLARCAGGQTAPS
jgi:predicted RNA-binding protein with PIN domain